MFVGSVDPCVAHLEKISIASSYRPSRDSCVVEISGVSVSMVGGSVVVVVGSVVVGGVGVIFFVTLRGVADSVMDVLKKIR